MTLNFFLCSYLNLPSTRITSGCWVCVVWCIESVASCMLAKHSTNWTTCLVSLLGCFLLGPCSPTQALGTKVLTSKQRKALLSWGYLSIHAFLLKHPSQLSSFKHIALNHADKTAGHLFMLLQIVSNQFLQAAVCGGQSSSLWAYKVTLRHGKSSSWS